MAKKPTVLGLAQGLVSTAMKTEKFGKGESWGSDHSCRRPSSVRMAVGRDAAMAGMRSRRRERLKRASAEKAGSGSITREA